ncbi:MAG TPA: class I SAM-dependent methyltransferase [Solirubrobacterales bacterium]|nr:class I SAM-dependent methyltransferase [Solirubrobacterales bacterium]
MGEIDPVKVYEESGRDHRALIESLLPDDWSWEGRRTLDFGCGVGRIMRQFAPEADSAEFWGCDLDRPSIDWLNRNLEPPFHFFVSDEEPDLPQEDGFFDLIYAFSVYTHFTDNWAAWLLEHHRVLKDDGLLLVTFLGEGMTDTLIGEKWDEDRIGMNPLLYGNSWELGGPIAFNSEWWIRAHWGRAFEILELRPHDGSDPPYGHGIALMRKKPVSLTVEDLKALEPDEPREILAIQHNVEQLRDDTLRLREALAQQEQRLRGEYERSASWRATAPARAAKRVLQEQRSRRKR